MLVEGFGGGLPFEGFAGSGVEGERDGVEVVAAVSGEVGALCDALFSNDAELGVEVDAPLAPAR